MMRSSCCKAGVTIVWKGVPRCLACRQDCEVWVPPPDPKPSKGGKRIVTFEGVGEGGTITIFKKLV